MSQTALRLLSADTGPEIEDARTGLTPAQSQVCVFAEDPLLMTLRAKLQQLGYRISECRGNKEPSGIAAIVSSAYDPDLALCRSLASRGNVILLSESNEFDLRLEAARAGVEAILLPPYDMVELSHWLNHFVAREQRTYSVLVVDDDEIAAHAYAAALSSSGVIAEAVTDPRLVPESISASQPDLLLLDVQMPEINGLELARIIRQSRSNISLPIVFLSAERDVDRQMLAREVGGDLFISKTVELPVLVSLIKLRAERAVLLREIMERDSLTGLLNHAGFKERITSELDRFRRTGSPPTICLLDIDRFKTINDRYGHQTGDHVILSLSQALSGVLRRTDIVARYGGEEFGVILLDTETDDAMVVMEKVRQTVAALDLRTLVGEPLSITISIGVAGADPLLSIEEMISAADRALYEAKAAGRNRVVLAER